MTRAERQALFRLLDVAIQRAEGGVFTVVPTVLLEGCRVALDQVEVSDV
jgi:hypothetical protein